MTGIRVLARGRAIALAVSSVWCCVFAFSSLSVVAAPVVEAESFHTESSGPDERGYEMVTPPDNENANVYVPYSTGASGGEGIPSSKLFRAADNGDAVAFVSDPTVGGNGSAGAGTGNENIARRLSSDGWSSESAQPAGVQFVGYSGFSDDLSTGFLISQLPLGSPAPPELAYWTPYTHSFATNEYHPAFTVTPPNRSKFEFNANHTFLEDKVFISVSSDLHHVLFEANDALTEAAALSPPSSKEDDLYDSIDGRLSLVNVLPDGTVANNSAFGQAYPISPEVEGSYEDGLSHVISDEGSRIFWTHLNAAGRSEALYVRENDSQPQSPLGVGDECTVPTDACTVQVDASQAGGSGGGGLFWTATSDGSEVFFTDSAEAHLTSDTVPGSGENLYVYDIADKTLVDLTPGGEVGVEGVADAGEDGRYVYFVATGVLSEAPNANGRRAVAGEYNLYVLHRGESPKFIGALPAPVRDGTNTYTAGGWQPDLGVRSAEATPDGRHLSFASNQNLTHNENTASGGSPEIYVYDSDTAALVCSSCDPSGNDAPAYVPLSLASSYQIRWISEDGSRVFFVTAGSLVPQDTNGKYDVYEWERDGSGSCHEAPGCTYLLSGGVSESSSWLLDASSSGDDVFMITRAKLVPQDGNENFDVYDAHVGAVQPISPPACSGTGCQGVPPAPPIFATPSSVTFTGVGNFTPGGASEKAKVRVKTPTRAQRLANALRRCRGMSRAKRRSCEVKAKRRYGVRSRSRKSTRGKK